MDTTLEDYIASNAELQDTINCVKAQINATKMGKNMLRKVLEDASKDEEQNEDEDEIEIRIDEQDLALNDEQDQQLWKGPSSKQNYLSLRFNQEIDDDEFEQMYENLNRGLKQVDINAEKDEKVVLDSEPKNHNFDLRHILDQKRLEYVPAVTSQQWRLREPNISGRRPAGMPPLVPISLLKDFTSAKIQKRNNTNANNRKKGFKIRNFSQRRTRNNHNSSFQLERPKIWDREPFAINTSSSNPGNGNSQLLSLIPTSSNFAAFIDTVGGVQCLPLNTVIAAATYLNGNASTGGLMGTLPNTSWTLNDLMNNQTLPFDLQGAAGCFNSANFVENAQNNILFGRSNSSNLHGIRGSGRVERSQLTGSPNGHNLQRALKMLLNTFVGNDNDNASPMNVDEISTNSNANPTALLSAAVQDMLKRGIVIKLADPEV